MQYTSLNAVSPDQLCALGAYVRARRTALGLTQTRLAERLGWTQERISILESGRYGMPSLRALAHLADCLEVGLRDLIEAAGYALERSETTNSA